MNHQKFVSELCIIRVQNEFLSEILPASWEEKIHKIGKNWKKIEKNKLIKLNRMEKVGKNFEKTGKN